MKLSHLRNIAIIAHVDHGKTTLVDRLLQATNTLGDNKAYDRVLDSNELEKERGITILSKNTSIQWQDYRINLIDTPGHADFGGEVERILSMVDAVLLIVDAVEGPMPQTRFVTKKAFEKNLNPVVVINKIDRDGSRCDWVINEMFDLFDKLGATEEQLDFPIVYASAIEGYATTDPEVRTEDMDVLFKAIIKHVPTPKVEPEGPFQMQISTLDYSSYLGTIGIGRIQRGQVSNKDSVMLIDDDGKTRSGKITQLLGFQGLQRIPVEQAQAGDIIALCGVDKLRISDTLCDPSQVEALPPLSVDKPTIQVMMRVNQSPFAGKDGKFVTSRKIYDRLEQEILHNVSLNVSETDDPDKFLLSGRGELHLSILIETMRREGYEFAISRPEVILKPVGDEMHEPYEQLIVEVDEGYQGAVMSALSQRQAVVENISRLQNQMRLEYLIPTRSLFGFQTEYQSLTAGNGIIYHSFACYKAVSNQNSAARQNGVLIANQAGKATGFALWNLQARGKMFIGPQTEVYEGMIIGLHNRENDLVVNVIKGKQLTNVRASGTDENIVLSPPTIFTVEQALGFIAEDELVEVTPQFLRLRKKYLKEHERKRHKPKS